MKAVNLLLKISNDYFFELINSCRSHMKETGLIKSFRQLFPNKILG